MAYVSAITRTRDLPCFSRRVVRLKHVMTRTWVKVWGQDEVWSLDALGQVQNPWGTGQKFPFPGPIQVLLHRQSLGSGGVPRG